jgi:uncharacterized membrane protein YhhN
MNASQIALIALAVAGAVNVAANLDPERWRRLVYATKPLLMPLLVVHYLAGTATPSVLVVAALVFGWLGDVFLMLPVGGEKMFMAGLGSFLVNQILYVVVFAMSIGPFHGRVFWLAAPASLFLVYGIVMYRVIEKGLGKMKGAVIVYMTAILAMGVTSLLRRAGHADAGFWLVLGGAASFIVSDSILAFDRFRRKLRFGQSLVMLTYVAGQALIVHGLMAA